MAETQLVFYDDIARGMRKEFRVVPFVDGDNIPPGTRVWVAGPLPKGWSRVRAEGIENEKNGHTLVQKD